MIMSSTFRWKPFLLCLTIMAAALFVTLPLMFIGYGATIPYSMPFLFPFGTLEFFLGWYTGSPHLLNPVFAPLIALIQYPAYGYYLGRAADSDKLRKRIWIIIGLHLAAATIAIVLTYIEFYRPSREISAVERVRIPEPSNAKNAKPSRAESLLEA
jgi:hypothetical protein